MSIHRAAGRWRAKPWEFPETSRRKTRWTTRSMSSGSEPFPHEKRTVPKQAVVTDAADLHGRCRHPRHQTAPKSLANLEGKILAGQPLEERPLVRQPAARAEASLGSRRQRSEGRTPSHHVVARRDARRLWAMLEGNDHRTERRGLLRNLILCYLDDKAPTDQSPLQLRERGRATL